MEEISKISSKSHINQNVDFDVIVIGAGISGLYQLYRLRELGMRVRVFEAGTGVGGTWYWNRYPGARFDSESYSYGYSFSNELLEEWDWSEHFASQPEILRYLEYVADKFDLRKDIQFSSRVVSASYNDGQNTWQITLDDGSTHISRFLITGIGLLSEPTLPRIDGLQSFQGKSFHTSRWPREPITFSDKRVAVIGTGATGVQTIQEVAKDVGHLTVFQRRPNWCAPLNNGKINSSEMKEIKASYPEMFERCKQTQAGFLHTMDPRGTFEVSEEERYAFWEELYAGRGFGIWHGNFRDIMKDPEANRVFSDFLANKIRERVQDPSVAEMLIPQHEGFGSKRVPLETGYYEAYNQENVKLVDISKTPITRITENGVLTSDKEFEFDYIIYATGFDAITGSFDRIDIRGVEGLRLKEQWESSLETFLGLQVSNFPNMFMILGPHAFLGNNPRSIEYSVEWITDLVKYMKERKLTRSEATKQSEKEWATYVKEQAEGLLSNEVDSWMTGINRNVEGKDTRIVAVYRGSAQSYRERCDEVAANGYDEMNLT